MTEILEESGQYRVRLEVDDDPTNPREDFDNVTYAVTVPHSHYADVAGSGPLVDGWDRIKNRSDAEEVFTRWARIFHGAVVRTHTPERGPNSIWYILPEQIKEIGGTPEEVLRAEIEEYQNWAEGAVYGYMIEKAVVWRRDDSDESMTTWEELDGGSCWGLIGYEYAAEAARDEFADRVKV